MKIFNYNGKQYEVQNKTYKYNDENYDCLYIKSDDFECITDPIEINDDLEFKIVMENEYLITGKDCSELKKYFK